MNDTAFTEPLRPGDWVRIVAPDDAPMASNPWLFNNQQGKVVDNTREPINAGGTWVDFGWICADFPRSSIRLIYRSEAK